MIDEVFDVLSRSINVVDYDLIIVFQCFLEIFSSQHNPIYLMWLEDDKQFFSRKLVFQCHVAELDRGGHMSVIGEYLCSVFIHFQKFHSSSKSSKCFHTR